MGAEFQFCKMKSVLCMDPTTNSNGRVWPLSGVPPYWVSPKWSKPFPWPLAPGSVSPHSWVFHTQNFPPQSKKSTPVDLDGIPCVSAQKITSYVAHQPRRQRAEKQRLPRQLRAPNASLLPPCVQFTEVTRPHGVQVLDAICVLAHYLPTRSPE